ncbi:TlpA family protein disulfide reductase [Niabella hirudinis]|uniref:TlpA family protein disulfide reductase n=1 Tax=Niabella hirudinis TaxID=1285929 RepID=UPI003EB928D8
MKITVASYKIQIAFNLLTVWSGDTINLAFNKNTGLAELAPDNDSLFFYSKRVPGFYKQHVDPGKWAREHNPNLQERINYTQHFFDQRKALVQDFFKGKKKSLQDLLLREIEHEKLYSYLTDNIDDTDIFQILDMDSIVTAYRSLPTILARNAMNYYRLTISNLANYLTKRDYSGLILSSDDRYKYLLVVAKKHFPTDVADFIMMDALYYFQKYPKDVNMQSAEMIWNTLQASSLSDEYKKTATQFYTSFKKSLKKLPDILAARLKTQNGKYIKLRDVIKQGKPVFIDLWATWCAPCIEEIPYLKKAEQNNPSVQFISISIDEDEPRWRKFLKENKMNPNKHFLMDDYKKNLLTDVYSISEVPRFMIFNAKGNCVSSNFNRPSEPDFNAALQKILKN